ncbi:MBL fold metallo-hydrolase (plasmid) [Agrobacterium leguminum]|uniref:Metallo-beta-lactamase family protein n=1 Tax=Agrobacterium deltaense NCPPB 1641 TaxID=1183425 RepID=A0A1S7UB50_9HYPH|nr:MULTISPECIES: MBL fold metallo-hydrolase [Agrobacterium]WFS69726.1 MBL fold metallo-hydrolase [Agrobacterium leguminum]CVI64029.1 putative Metallo-beta-lactamase family protein [Agrobacterium deltaense NCPPB 1641]
MREQVTTLADREAGVYRFALGDWRCAVILDGWLNHPLHGFIGGPEADIESLHLRDFARVDHWPMDENVVFVDTGTNKVLVDAGLGPLDWYGEETGRLPGRLLSAGIELSSIDTIILTHADPDHCFGLVNSRGEKVFPNADVFVSSVEYTWARGGAVGGKVLKENWPETARKVFARYEDRLKFFDGDAEILPGISVLLCAGHTPGHHVVSLTSNGDRMIVGGDAAHHHLIELKHSKWKFLGDFDPAAAVDSKRRLLNSIADDGSRYVGYHFPWPGIGRVVRIGDDFQFDPEAVASRLDR